MFIGHIPAGYLCTKGIFNILQRSLAEKIRLKYFFLWGMMGSILPDFDMFYFYLIDNRQHLHHGYWSHIPLFWGGVFFLLFAISVIFQSISLRLYILVLSVNVFIHLFLDTIAGKIRWFYPFSSYDVVFFHVPAVHNWWVWNFVFHWTFLFEITLLMAAVCLMLRSDKTRRFFKMLRNKDDIISPNT